MVEGSGWPSTCPAWNETPGRSNRETSQGRGHTTPFTRSILHPCPVAAAGGLGASDAQQVADLRAPWLSLPAPKGAEDTSGDGPSCAPAWNLWTTPAPATAESKRCLSLRQIGRPPSGPSPNAFHHQSAWGGGNGRCAHCHGIGEVALPTSLAGSGEINKERMGTSGAAPGTNQWAGAWAALGSRAIRSS